VQDVLAEKITEKLERAMAREYGELLAEHEKDYREFYDRVALSLPEKEENAALPTDERLQRIISGGTDEGLAKLLFDYGRYLLIGCSRPGDLPATLQGIWNKDFMAPWDSKYTININTEMNYWPAEVCALPECHTALFDLIGRMREHGRSIGCTAVVALWHITILIFTETARRRTTGFRRRSGQWELPGSARICGCIIPIRRIWNF